MKRNNAIRGGVVNNPNFIGGELSADLVRIVRYMEEEVAAAFKAYQQGGALAGTNDAGALDIGDFILSRLRRRFSVVIGRYMAKSFPTYVERLEKNATNRTLTSLREISEDITINRSLMSDKTRGRIAEAAQNAANLIKTVPERYLEGIGKAVTKARLEGKGAYDIYRVLLEQGEKTRNWAHNTALDQTRKINQEVSRGRMADVGIRRVEWVHTGGSNDPRSYHMRSVEAGGLNGLIFDLNDPPIINEKTGERGFPGDEPNCRCRLRPVIDLSGINNATE